MSTITTKTEAMDYLKSTLSDIADAIRTKEGSTGAISPVDFPKRTMALSQGVQYSESEIDAYATTISSLDTDANDAKAILRNLFELEASAICKKENTTATIAVSDFAPRILALWEDTFDPNPILNNNSWDIIRAVSDAGNGDNYWSVGDTKSVTINGTVGNLSVNETYWAYIIGFNHNSDLEGTGIQFQGFKTAQTDGVDVCLVDSYYNNYRGCDGTKYFNINHYGSTSTPYNTNYGGWAACDMRYDILGSTDKQPSVYGSVKTTDAVGYDASETCATNPVANTLMAALPEDLRAVMKPITKYTDNTGNSSNAAENVTATVDYLPLLAEYEIFGARTYANQYELQYQKQYDYFAAGNTTLKYQHSTSSSTAAWWERSAFYGGAAGFCFVSAGSGGANRTNASYSDGVAPAFMV